MQHNDNQSWFPGAPAGDEEEMEIRLWAYIDGLSEETSVIEKLVAENSAWKAKYSELLELHGLVQETELDEPSLRFTRNVMEEIARLQISPAAKKYINTKIIWGIAAFFLSVIAGFLVYGFSQLTWSAGDGSRVAGIEVPALDFSRMFNNTYLNIFMMFNVVLGLMLLDRFLSMKRKNMMEGR